MYRKEVQGLSYAIERRRWCERQLDSIIPALERQCSEVVEIQRQLDALYQQRKSKAWWRRRRQIKALHQLELQAAQKLDRIRCQIDNLALDLEKAERRVEAALDAKTSLHALHPNKILHSNIVEAECELDHARTKELLLRRIWHAERSIQTNSESAQAARQRHINAEENAALRLRDVVTAHNAIRAAAREPPRTPVMPYAQVIVSWIVACDESFADYAGITAFPEPPESRCVVPDICGHRKRERALRVCDCSIRRAFETAGVSLKAARRRWHPDRFRACADKSFAQMAGEVLLVVDGMYANRLRHKAGDGRP